MAWVIISCLWVFSLTNPTFAQQAVRVYLTDGRDKDATLSAFIAVASSTTLGQTVPVVFVRDQSRTDPPALILRTTAEQTWQIEPVPPQGFPRSPLLPESPGFAIEISFDGENLRWILDALLAYSNKECARLTGILMQPIGSAPPETQSALHYYLGHCLVAERYFDEAIEQYRHSIASASTITWQQQSALAWVLLSAGQPEASVELVNELVMSPDFDTADMLALRAYYHLLIFDTDRATQDALKALAARPNHVGYLVLNGQIALVRYEWDEALIWLNRAWDINPNSTEANYQLGILYYTRADRIRAARFFTRVIQIAPYEHRAASAYRYLVMIRHEIGALGTEE